MGSGLSYSSPEGLIWPIKVKAKTSLVGIDLGTEYCCICAWKENEVVVIKNERGCITTPSYVALREQDGRWLVGDDAKDQAAQNPLNTVFDVKRLIGRRFGESSIETDRKNFWSYNVIYDDEDHGKPKVELKDRGVIRRFSAEELSAKLLEYLKNIAEVQLGDKVTRAVIAVPAGFNQTQRQMTIDAAKIAKFDQIELINEPSAIVMAHLFLQKNMKYKIKTLYVDLGGGTLNVSFVDGNYAQNILYTDGLIQFQPPFELKIKGSNCDTHLGGNDFNQRMIEYVLDEIKNQDKKDFFDDKKVVHLLNIECEKAKLRLSEESSTQIRLQLDDFDKTIEITRETFENLCGDLVDRIVDLVKSLIDWNESNIKKIENVYLTGGSSKIPIIKKSLEKIFPGKIKFDSRDELVAQGACLNQSAFKFDRNDIEPLDPDMEYFNDCASFSYGIEDAYGKMVIFLKKGEEIPETVQKYFQNGLKLANDGNGRKNVVIKVYQGESDCASENYFVGEVGMSNVKLPLNLKVTLSVNSSGKARIQIEDLNPGGAKTDEIELIDWRHKLDERHLEDVANEGLQNAFLDAYRATRNGFEMISFREIWNRFLNNLHHPIQIKDDDFRRLDESKVNDLIDIEFKFPFGESDSENQVKRVKVMKIFKSNAKPKLINCLPMNKKLIFKKGDNLYDEQIVMAFLNTFNDIWAFHKTCFKWDRDGFTTSQPISNLYYKIVPLSNPRLKAGFIEWVEAEAAEDLYDRNYSFRNPQHKFNHLSSSLRHGGNDFARICASGIATFVSMFVLAIGDRHQGNILLANDHRIFNIDFGYSFGENVFLIETGDFPIPFFVRNYLERNGMFDRFINECWNAMQILVDYQPIFESLSARYMKDPKKKDDAKKVFQSKLNTQSGTFCSKLTAGSYLALPNYFAHNSEQIIRSITSKAVNLLS